jgi:hypothetical protein
MTRVCVNPNSWLACALGAAMLTCGWAQGGETPEAAAANASTESTPSEFSEEARQEALEELRRKGLLAAEATGGLLDFILNPDTPLDLRCRAVLALGEVGPRNLEQARSLAALLETPETNGQLRWTILMTFGENRVLAPIFRPAILRVAADTSADLILRRQALFHLRNQGVLEDAAEVFAQILADTATDPGLRAASLDGLRQAVVGSPGISEVLARVAVDSQEMLALRQGALQVLAALGDESQAVPALRDVVLDPEAPPPLRLQAARSLDSLSLAGSVADQLAPLLTRSDTPLDVRRAIAGLSAVSRRPLAGDPGEWIALLDTAEQPIEIRRLALDSLIRTRSLEPAAIKTCIRLLNDPVEDVSLKLAVITYLREIGSNAEPARETLEAILEYDRHSPALREQASSVLAELSRAWLTSPEGQPSSALAMRLSTLESTVALFEASGLDTPVLERNLEAIRQVQAILATEYRSRWWHRSTTWMRRHPWSAAGLILVALVVLVILAGATVVTVKTHRSAHPPAPSPPPPDPPNAARARELAAQVLLPDHPDRAQAIDTLTTLGSDAAPAVPLLAQALRDVGHDADGRYGALQALTQLKEVAGASQPALLATLNNRTDYLFLRIGSLELLAAMSPDSLTSRTFLERLTDPEEPEILRVHAGHALASQPPPVEDWLPRVAALANHSHPIPVRDLAAQIRAAWTPGV